MKKIKILMLLFCTSLLFLATQASAKGIIPIGTVEQIDHAADLPKTEEYLADDGQQVALGILHKEFMIAYIPIWVIDEPKLILYAPPNTDSYYTVDDEFLEQIINDEKLNKADLLKLSFYNRYGGKLIVLVVVCLIFGVKYMRKKPEENETEAEAEEENETGVEEENKPK